MVYRTGLIAPVALVALLALVVPAAASFVLNSDYLQVGVDDSGGLLADNSGDLVGLRLDPDATSVYGVDDFIAPDVPLEFYSIGVTTTFADFVQAGYSDTNVLGLTTTNTSAGAMRRASSVGSWSAYDLGISQALWFSPGEKSVHFLVTLTNNGSQTLNDVVYARGFDPDQDRPRFATGDTQNSLVGTTPHAYGPNTELDIAIADLTGGGTASADLSWSEDPYWLLRGFGSPPSDFGENDATINMAWGLGDMVAGAVKTIQWDYVLDAPNHQGPPVPEPSSLLLGLAGLAVMGIARRRR
jgi:hypothetical protein